MLLPPELCFDMGLVLHEVATNSMKYGSLGGTEGAIRVNWSIGPVSDEADVFRFAWQDPHAVGPTPSKGSGFGSKLMGAIMDQKWNGRLTVQQTPGFRLSVEIPIPHDVTER